MKYLVKWAIGNKVIIAVKQKWQVFSAKQLLKESRSLIEFERVVNPAPCHYLIGEASFPEYLLWFYTVWYSVIEKARR